MSYMSFWHRDDQDLLPVPECPHLSSVKILHPYGQPFSHGHPWQMGFSFFLHQGVYEHVVKHLDTSKAYRVQMCSHM